MTCHLVLQTALELTTRVLATERCPGCWPLTIRGPKWSSRARIVLEPMAKASLRLAGEVGPRTLPLSLCPQQQVHSCCLQLLWGLRAASGADDEPWVSHGLWGRFAPRQWGSRFVPLNSRKGFLRGLTVSQKLKHSNI